VVFIDQWIFEILSGSWQKAYLFDSELIKEIQYEVCNLIFKSVVKKILLN